MPGCCVQTATQKFYHDLLGKLRGQGRDSLTLLVIGKALQAWELRDESCLWWRKHRCCVSLRTLASSMLYRQERQYRHNG